MASKRALATAPCAACGAAAKKDATFLYTHGRKPEDYVPLCAGCWKNGDNDEVWDDKIQQRIADRRAHRTPKRHTFNVLVTVKQTWSLRGIEAEDEDAVVAKVKAMELDQLERHGHEIDCELEIDSVEREHSELPVTGKKGRRRGK